MFEIVFLTVTYIVGMAVTVTAFGYISRQVPAYDELAIQVFTVFGTIVWPIALPIIVAIPLAKLIYKVTLRFPIQAFVFLYDFGGGRHSEFKLIGPHTKSIVRRLGR